MKRLVTIATGNPETEHGGESEQPDLPLFRSWRGVYIFVLISFILYIVVLTALSRAFS